MKKKLFKEKSQYGDSKLSDLIRKFTLDDENLDPCAWDDFECANLGDPYENLIQKLVFLIGVNFPSSHPNEWCNKSGGEALLNLANVIESNRVPFPPTKEEEVEMSNNLIPIRYLELTCPKL